MSDNTSLETVGVVVWAIGKEGHSEALGRVLKALWVRARQLDFSTRDLEADDVLERYGLARRKTWPDHNFDREKWCKHCDGWLGDSDVCQRILYEGDPGFEGPS